MATNYEHLTAAFEKLTIDPASFGHIEHVGVAYVMLSKYGFLTAATKYSENINAIATRAGAAQKFNMTITIAFLSIISERMEQAAYDNAVDFIAANLDLITNNPLKGRYSVDRLTSSRARKTFLLPDVAA